MHRRKYRVIQWATGAMDRSCMRAVIDRPDTKLAGLFVYSAGQVSHVDWRWRGVVGGEERFAMDVSRAVDPQYTGEHPDLWTLSIKGEPDVSLQFNAERQEGVPGSTTAEQMAVGAR